MSNTPQTVSLFRTMIRFGYYDREQGRERTGYGVSGTPPEQTIPCKIELDLWRALVKLDKD